MDNNNFLQDNAGEDKSFQKADIEGYKDTGGLTLKKLNFGLWYIEHKKIIRSIFIGFLIVVSAVSWSYTIYGFAYYITRGMAEDELLAKQIIDSNLVGHDYILEKAPRDLAYKQPKTLKLADGKYDFFVEIVNPNKDHWAEFDYYFSAGGGKTDVRKGFILPDESKFLTVLSQDFKFSPSSVQLIVENMSWRRINKHKISDFSDYRARRLDIAVAGAEFISSSKSGLSEKLNLNKLIFSAKNNSAYNYWDVNFVISLFSNANIVGINEYTLGEFMSGETRNVEMSWPGILANINKIEITPEVNIMSDDIYIEYAGGTGEEK